MTAPRSISVLIMGEGNLKLHNPRELIEGRLFAVLPSADYEASKLRARYRCRSCRYRKLRSENARGPASVMEPVPTDMHR